MKNHSPIAIFFLCTFFTLYSFAQTAYQTDVINIFSWDEFNDKWDQDLTQQLSYANGGIKETNLLALSFPSLIKIYQHNKSYNTSNNIELSVHQIWDNTLLQWHNSSQIVYTYNGNNVISQTTKFYNTTTMTYVNSIRELFEYQGSTANLTKQTYQNWDTNTNTWINTDKLDISYVNGLGTVGTFSIWDGVTATWVADERDTVTYDTNDLPILVISERLVSSVWQIIDRTLLYYTEGLVTEQVEQEGNGTTWVNTDRELNTYDDHGNKKVYILESWVSSAWQPYYKEEKSFSVTTLSNDSFNDTAFKIYPNPASDMIKVTSLFPTDKMEMYDILGKHVLLASFSNELVVKNLNSGIYLLKVYSNNSSISKKIIIK